MRTTITSLLAAITVAWGAPAGGAWVDGPLDAEDASFLGEEMLDGAGTALASAGDVDGDGRDDVLIGAPSASTTFDPAVENGKVYFLRGGDLAGELDIPLDKADAQFFGRATGDYMGTAVTAVGDADGDGLGDLAFGAPGHNGVGLDSGEVYYVSSLGPWLLGGGIWPIEDVAVVIAGVQAEDQVGQALAGAGDFTGDGRPDLVIGAPGGRVADSQCGYVYLMSLEQITQGGQEFLLAAYPRLDGVRDGDRTGEALESRADLDGDGLADVVIGAPRYDADEELMDVGRVYVVRGHPEFGLPLSQTYDLVTIAHLIIEGDEIGQRSGQAVAVAPDINGDGHPDLVIGAPGDGHGGLDAGAAYVFLGTGADQMGHFSISEADSVFVGGALGELAGASLSVARDVSGDGLTDLLIGAYNANDHAVDSGTAYLVLGRTEPSLGMVPLPDHATAFFGVAVNDHLGLAVAGLGDVNGDGLSDLLVGAPGNDEAGGSAASPWDGAGKSYLILGQECRDADRDGAAAADCGGGDCNDLDASVHPGAPENCHDGEDNDCDGDVDLDDADCAGDDDDDTTADDDDDGGGDSDEIDDGGEEGPGRWGGGGLVCEPGTTIQGAALPAPLILLALVLRRLRR